MKRSYETETSSETDEDSSRSEAEFASDEENEGEREGWTPRRSSSSGSTTADAESGKSPQFTVFPRSIEWERSPAMREKKCDHQDWLDDRFDGDREAHIYATTLKGRDIHLEPNMFPYECDEGIEHWTLWSRRDLRHDEIVASVTKWCTANAPWAFSEWAYEENPHVSFRIPHCHVFFRRRNPSWQQSPPSTASPRRTTTPATGPARKRCRTRWDVPPSASSLDRPLTERTVH